MKRQQVDTSRGIPVYLNVYNFWSGFNKGCGCVGLGVYHTAIQISYIEYMYYGFDGDESGVIEIQPKSAAYEFGEQILLGYMNYSYYDLQTQVLQPLRIQFLGSRYDLLNNNCNHFAHRLAEMLGLSQKFPSKIFRVTNFFNTMRCCIPNCILSGRLDWFITPQQEEMQSNLHQRLSNQQYDRSYRKISRTSSKYHQFLEEEADDIYVKEIESKPKSKEKSRQLN